MLSEPEDWTEGDAQVVVGAVVEVNCIACLKPQAHGPQTRLNPCCRIDGAVQAGGAKAEHGAGEIAVGEQAGA